MANAMDRAPSARAYDINGWFEVADNPISREGIFPYSGAQVGHPDRGRIFQVYRPGEELSAPDALASFRLMPIIDDHTMLGEGHTPAEDVGVAGVIGENVKFDRGVMTANLKIFSKALAQKIKNGKTQGDVVFQKRTSLVFKKLQVVRFYDAKRNALIYLTYSDKIVDGSPKNALSAVPIMPWNK